MEKTTSVTVINNIQRREKQDFKKRKVTFGRFLQKAQNKEESIKLYSI